MSERRLFFLATNDSVAVGAVVPLLRAGRNELTKDEAMRYAESLAVGGDGSLVDRKRRQVARVLWGLFHDAYSELPEWLW